MDKSFLRTFLLINFYALKKFGGRAHGFKIYYFLSVTGTVAPPPPLSLKSNFLTFCVLYISIWGFRHISKLRAHFVDIILPNSFTKEIQYSCICDLVIANIFPTSCLSSESQLLNSFYFCSVLHLGIFCSVI